MKCAVLFLSCRFALAVEVDPDWDLLTDFTTDYKLDSEAWPQHHNHYYQDYDDYDPHEGNLPVTGVEHGTIQFDFNTEKIQVKADFSATVVDPKILPPGDNITGHGEFTFDGTKTFASVRGVINAPIPRVPMPGATVALEFCIKVNVPPGLFPPSFVFQKKLSEIEEKVTRGLASMPHSDGELGGQSVVVYTSPNGEASFALLPNGVPVDFEIKGKPLIQFSGWSKGAGDIQEVGCHSQSSASELLATPGGTELLERLDKAIAALETMSQLTAAGKILPPKPSVLVKYAAKEELAQMRFASSFPWTTTAILGGIAGVLISTGVVMAARRPGRFPDRLPLISDNE